MPTTHRRWWLQAVGVSALLAAPIVAVTYPPLTDLPQQVAQMHLLERTLAGDERFRVQWWHPNKLAYLPIALGWLLGGGLWAAKVVATTIVVAWTVALHALAAARGRSLTLAALAATLVWNHAMYWGFLTFQLGFPLFVAWVILLDDAVERPGRRRLLARIVVASGLYFAHVLWLGAAIGLAVVEGVLRRVDRTEWLERSAALAGPLLGIAVWYPSLTDGGFVSQTVFGRSVLERLEPAALVETLYGGLRGALEPLAAAVLLLVVGGSVGRWWRRDRAVTPLGPACRFDGGLVAAAALLASAAFFLPDVAQATICFASRWLPPAAALLLLAVPTLAWSDRRPIWFASAARVAALGAVALFAMTTTVTWRDGAREELAGFNTALAGIPAGSRVLGLDFERTSPRLRGKPYLHLDAWSQVLHGSELSRSFAEAASSLVVYRRLPVAHPWTPNLDWFPERLRRSDLVSFDYVLWQQAGGPPAQVEADPALEIVEPRDRWTLLRVVAPAVDDSERGQ
ncbi:MAG: hypothetical protein AAGN46_15590 [Acidobacteriota bacterium]